MARARGAVELRIALALVLLEHQPDLSLQDWLDSLRRLVRARKGAEPPLATTYADNVIAQAYAARTEPEQVPKAPAGSVRWNNVPGGARSGVQERAGRRPSETDSANAALDGSDLVPLSTRLRLAASTLGADVVAALEPLLSPPSLDSPPQQKQRPPTPLPLPAVTRFLAALETSLEPLTRAGLGQAARGSRVGQADSAAMANRFGALGTVSSWLLDRLAVSGGGRNAGKNGAGKAQEADPREATECVAKLSALLAGLATAATRDQTSLETLVTLFAQLGDRFPGLGAHVLLPSLFQQLVACLGELLVLDAFPQPLQSVSATAAAAASGVVANPDETTGTVSTLLSLCHLVLDSTIPAGFLVQSVEIESDALARAEQDLVRLLGTHGVDVQLAEVPLPFASTVTNSDVDGVAGGISVESGVVGLLERLWELRSGAEVGEESRDRSRSSATSCVEGAGAVVSG
ncbi:hypothetical protein JCM3774_003809 [Rhodotorula dairenensis]